MSHDLSPAELAAIVAYQNARIKCLEQKSRLSRRARRALRKMARSVKTGNASPSDSSSGGESDSDTPTSTMEVDKPHFPAFKPSTIPIAPPPPSVQGKIDHILRGAPRPPGSEPRFPEGQKCVLPPNEPGVL